MNLLFTVCGRAGSKGVKNKNISDFMGNPLVYHTLAAIDLFMVKNKGQYDMIDIAVNTDSKELVNLIGQTACIFQLIKRKPELATDISSKLDVIRETLKSCEAIKKVHYDFVIDLDITSPLRSADDIQALVHKIQEKHTTEVVFSVVPSRRNPYFNMVMKDEQGIRKVCNSTFTARQQAPEVYDMNASMYIYKNEFLYDETRISLFDAEIEMIEMIDTAILDIDHKEDFELMQIIAPYIYQKYPAYRQINEHIEVIKNK